MTARRKSPPKPSPFFREEELRLGPRSILRRGQACKVTGRSGPFQFYALVKRAESGEVAFAEVKHVGTRSKKAGLIVSVDVAKVHR